MIRRLSSEVPCKEEELEELEVEALNAALRALRHVKAWFHGSWNPKP